MIKEIKPDQAITFDKTIIISTYIIIITIDLDNMNMSHQLQCFSIMSILQHYGII